jgi:mRNA interferase RelE/StbE
LVSTIEITRTAEKQIKRLNRSSSKVHRSFSARAGKNRRESETMGKPLHRDKPGLWRYRIGDYRLICDIQDEQIAVLVLEVAHRKNVYR